jgi:hypothetical protein
MTNPLTREREFEMNGGNSSVIIGAPSDERCEKDLKKVNKNVLEYCKLSLARLESGERTRGIPEYVAQDCINGLRKRIAELES